MEFLRAKTDHTCGPQSTGAFIVSRGWLIILKFFQLRSAPCPYKYQLLINILMVTVSRSHGWIFFRSRERKEYTTMTTINDIKSLLDNKYLWWLEYSGFLYYFYKTTRERQPEPSNKSSGFLLSSTPARDRFVTGTKKHFSDSKICSAAPSGPDHSRADSVIVKKSNNVCYIETPQTDNFIVGKV